MSRGVWSFSIADDDDADTMRDAFRSIPIEDLRRYLALAAAQEGEDEGEGEEEDEDFAPSEEDDDYTFFPAAGAHGKWYEEVQKPTKEGLALLNSGQFGRLGHQVKSRAGDPNVARTLLRRGNQVRPVPREDIVSVRTLHDLSWT